MRIPYLSGQRWPVKAFVISETAGKPELTETRARFHEKAEGGRVYEVDGFGETRPVPKGQIHRTTDGTDVVFLLEKDRGTLQPKKLTIDDEQELDVDLEMIQNWKQANYRRADQQHDPENWFQRNKRELMFAMLMTGLLVIGYMLSTSMVEAATLYKEGMMQGAQAAGATGGGAPPG